MMIVDEEIRDKVRVLLQTASIKFILPFYKNLSEGDIDTKSSADDFVTIADKQAENFLAENLTRIIHGSTVIGEEACSDNKDVLYSLCDELVWTVDPIDGTRNFINGNERFCSMIAFLEDGKPTASWIFIPTEGKCYYADVSGVLVGEDGCAFQPLGLSYKKEAPINLIDVKCSASLRHLDPDTKMRVKSKIAHLKNRVFIGSAGIEATMLAQRQIDFIFHSTTTAWDHAPVDMFCRASGGNSKQISLSESLCNDFSVENKAPVLFVQNKDLCDEIAHFITG